ncbi:MAG: hypothetical protein JWO47_247 [Candidatus Saccharibacteria bacterium]|nr:hypothetical protein [Candidatus Saccharibacteria bacterium]
MSENGKHTVYIDLDDEITAIIEKVKAAPEKIVALVLPKRATVLQSVVNMKLLKKSALAAKKSLVLITSEAGLLPLAGVVGIHVAKSLQSKPEIPLLPRRDDDMDSEISEALDDEPEVDKTKSVGALAAAAKPLDDDETETIELDDVDTAEEPDAEAPKGKKKLAKVFKVPNFDRFRLSFFLVILAVILLVGGWVFAAVVLPKATVLIDTDTSTSVSDITFTANTALNDLDLSKSLVPAVQKEVKKTDTEKATPTGKKDNGTKATGTMTLTNCINDANSHTVPAGTGFSNGSLTFTTNEAVTLEPALFSGPNCKSSTFGLNKDVGVTAIAGGTNYNVPAHAYTSSISGINAYGSDMAGGTTSVVTVVAQSDIDAAVAKMKGRQDTSATTDLANALQAGGLKGLDETKTISDPVITATPAVGTEGTADITITSVTTYDILGVKTDFLNQLIKKDVSTKATASKEGILDNGLGSALIHIVNKKSPTEVQMSLHAIVISGPTLDAGAIKDEIRGKKKGDAEQIISSKPGVKSVTITYKPFWVLSTPKAVKKITVTIKKPVVTPSTGKDTSNGYNP